MSKKMVRRGSLTLSALVLALGFSLSGCGADVDDAQSRIQVINAQTLAKQPAGQPLIVDLGDEKSYTFDYSQGLDFSRIAVRMSDGQQVSMTDWLAGQKETTGVDLTQRPDKVFRIGNQDPAPGQVGAQCGCKRITICVNRRPWISCVAVRVCW